MTRRSGGRGGRSGARSGGGRREGRAGQVRSSGTRRAILLFLVLAPGAALILWFVWIPWPRDLDTTHPERTALMDQRLQEARQAGDTLVLRQEWVSLAQISPHLVRTVLHAEDQRFREHAGIDWKALADEVHWQGGETFTWTSRGDQQALFEAIRYAWGHRDEIRGRSTLTQQLAKNLYFGTDRSLPRKAREFVVTHRLERALEKDRILELYLNVAEWGPGIFGAEAAAREYFGKGAGDITLAEAAALAGTLPHPLTSNPTRSPAQMRWRQARILEALGDGATPTQHEL